MIKRSRTYDEQARGISDVDRVAAHQRTTVETGDFNPNAMLTEIERPTLDI